METETATESEKDRDESDYFESISGDSNRKPQPNRENLECYPQIDIQKQTNRQRRMKL